MSADYIEGEFQEAPLAVREEAVAPPSLFGSEDPVAIVERAVRVADALKAVVVSKKLVANIQGKEYPQVEAWLTLAAMLRLTTVCEWSRPVESGWEARVFVRDANGNTIGAAEAQCLQTEKSKRSWEDYALRSMSQTRATSKALRSVLGFVMVLAGYQATPAEEMPADPQPPKPAPEPKAPPISALVERAVALRLIPAASEFAAWMTANVPACANLRQGDKISAEQKRAISEALDEIEAAEALPEPDAPKEAASAPPGPKVGLSDAQRARFMAMFKEREKQMLRAFPTATPTGARHLWAMRLLGETKGSTKDWTAEDVRKAFTSLEAMPPDSVALGAA
jgi:hypothetical protein